MDKRVSTINITDDEESCLDESDSSAVLGYIKQMLMEEDTEEKYSMFQDSLALQDTERSFYEVITDNYPPPHPSSSSSTHHHLENYPSVESPDQSFSGSSSDNSTLGCASSCSTSNSAESHLNPVLPNTFPIPSNFVIHSNTHSAINTGFGFFNNGWRGVEQGTRFLPKHTDTPFIVDPDNTTFFPSFTNAPHVVIKTETEESVEGEHFHTVSRGLKNREREEYEVDGRSRKQSAAYMDDSKLSELFDKVLLGTGLGKGVPPNTTVHQNHETILTNMLSGGGVSENDEEVVGLRALLMLCAQAIASNTPSFAKQLVKQIKQHSSPIGDETQRLAHYFGNALEARLDGTGYQVYSVLSSKRTSAKDMIKAYHVHASLCPFEKLAIIFANNSIWNLAKEAETLHIIDFGIRYGFKWPALINRVSKRAGGPPKLRITGIELPQPGFRPEERVHETGRRLACYCKRFNIPFEFIAIAQRWDTVRVEDLKIERNEFVAVNCMFRFENLLDETSWFSTSMTQATA
ncbi:Scarecrow protein 14 [Spatholobus suberectus]|nr:Scarecrow protein 14 [Spatholobus suberectus]